MDRQGLAERIAALAEIEDGTRLLGLDQARELSVTAGCSLREVELAALDAGVVPRRYARSAGTVGTEGQAALLRATVAVVGLGGLGGYVTEALARAGVGHLILIDGDVFQESNLNRQLLSGEDSLGASKAEAARRRVAAVNAAVTTTVHAQMLTAESLPTLLKRVDVVVDALDRLPIRLTLQKGAQRLGVPMVHGSVAGFLGQVMTVFPDDPGLTALYGDGSDLPQQGLEATLGTPTATPMAVAAWQAQEAVKIITGCGEPLRNRLLFMDMEIGAIDFLKLS